MTAWVVVGAGAAGCVVAGRLAEAGHDVTLIEAGSASPGRAVRAASFFDAMAEPGRLFPGSFARGRGIGGSSAVNGMIATAGDPAQYARWGWHDAEEAFARVRVPLERPDDEELGPVDRALLAAAPDAEVVTLTRHAGRRVTAADAYLTGAPVEVVADATVVRLQATGVVLADGRVVEAERIALAAGALGSPALLPGVDRPPRNHEGVAITLRLRVDVDPHSLVTSCLLRRGHVQIQPLNHLGPAAPGHGMLLVAAMVPGHLDAGRALARELLAHRAFAELVDDVTVGDGPAGIYHATSTCPMGDVVDEDGLVVGADNIHVVDASVFPDLPTTNTYLPTLMLAERLAARLVDL